MNNTVKTVTPEQAAKWLDPAVNKTNRDVRHSHVSFLADEIRSGRWKVTHQGIAFSVTGRLLDGQHRLAAIVMSGKSVQMFVATGLEEEAFRAIDCGMKRANYDRIHLVNNQTQNKLLCQSIRIFLYETSGSKEISVGAIEDEYLSKDKAWEWMADEFESVTPKLKKASVLASFAVYYFVNSAKAKVFLAGYRDGIGLCGGSPELKLRNDATMGSHLDVTYWRAQAIMRHHLNGKAITTVHEASEDMLGNKNSVRLIRSRQQRGVKSGITRKAKKGSA